MCTTTAIYYDYYDYYNWYYTYTTTYVLLVSSINDNLLFLFCFHFINYLQTINADGRTIHTKLRHLSHNNGKESSQEEETVGDEGINRLPDYLYNCIISWKE